MTDLTTAEDRAKLLDDQQIKACQALAGALFNTTDTEVSMETWRGFAIHGDTIEDGEVTELVSLGVVNTAIRNGTPLYWLAV